MSEFDDSIDEIKPLRARIGRTLNNTLNNTFESPINGELSQTSGHFITDKPINGYVLDDTIVLDSDSDSDSDCELNISLIANPTVHSTNTCSPVSDHYLLMAVNQTIKDLVSRVQHLNEDTDQVSSDDNDLSDDSIDDQMNHLNDHSILSIEDMSGLRIDGNDSDIEGLQYMSDEELDQYLNPETKKAIDDEQQRQERLADRHRQRFADISDDESNHNKVKSNVYGRPPPQPLVYTIDSDDEDDEPSLVVIKQNSPNNKPNEELIEDILFSDFGVHTDDKYNIPEEDGQVIINVGHPPEDPDLYLSPVLAKAVKPHQIGGIRFLYDSLIESLNTYSSNPGLGCILSHAMGLGKTIQVIGLVDVLLKAEIMKRVLIVVPVNTLQNWCLEFERWSPDRNRSYLVYSVDAGIQQWVGRAREVRQWRKNGGVLLLGYEMFKSLIKENDFQAKQYDGYDREALEKLYNRVRQALVDPGPDLVVCDEGHRIKNSNTAIAIAMKQIATKRRVILTGTPLQNNLMEYWCMCDFVRPYILGSQSEFRDIFEKPIKNGQCIDSNDESKQLMKRRALILHKRVTPFVQRRSHDVLQDALPMKREYVLMCRMTDIQRELMETFIETAINNPSLIGRMDGKRISVLTLFAICTKIWNHPDIIHDVVLEGLRYEDLELHNPDNVDMDVNAPADRMTDYSFIKHIFNGYDRRLIDSSNKMVILFAIIEKCVQIGDRLLVFSQSLLTLNLIEYFLKRVRNWSNGKDYYRLDGSTPAKERQRLIESFNSRSDKYLFLISTRAGGLGINLTGANRIVIMDTNWNPCHDAQAACRVFRYGQQKNCYIYRLVCDKTLEKTVYNKQIVKQGMAKRVVDNEVIENVCYWKDIESLLEILRDMLNDDNDVDINVTPDGIHSLNDDILEEVCFEYSRALTCRPIEYDSLLEDQKDQKLTDNERRIALQEIQLKERPIAPNPHRL